MKIQIANHCQAAIKRTSRQIIGCATAIAMAAAPLHAEVEVFFNNTGLVNTAPADLGTVTLAFTVDGSGNVTLDASTTGNATAVTAVNAWDGPVGTISHSGAFNSSFTLTMTGFDPGTGDSKNLRLVDVIATGSTGGLVGVQGVNQFRIDDNNREAIRFAAASVPAGSKLKVTSMDWRNSNGSPTQRAFSASPAINVTNVASTITGTWSLSSSGLLLGSNESFAFGTTTSGDTSKGYSLGALRFDIVNASALAAPTGLTATTNGSQVVLDWNDTPNATSYSVYRSETAGGPFGTAIATGVTTSAYTDNTVSTGVTYHYVVTASDASSESDDSNEVSIAVLIPAPTGLTRVQRDGVIDLDWADSTSPIFASYSVYRSTTSGGPYTLIAASLATSAYADSDVTNGITYYYVVRAVDNVIGAGFESANSIQVSATPFAPVSGSTLYAHLDASDESSVSVDGSFVVSSWADQSPNSLNATSANGVGEVYFPSFSFSDSGLEGVEFGYHPSGSPKSMLSWFNTAQQAQWLDFDSGAGALPYGGFTVFAVVHPDQILAGNARDVVMSSTENDFMLRYENRRPQLRLGGTLIQGAAGVVVADETVVLAVNYNATTGEVQFWNSQNGAITTGNVPAKNFSSTALIYLGGSANPDQFMQGMIGEVKVYRGVMNTSEFLSERANLVEKWVGEPVPSGLAITRQLGSVELQWNKAVPFNAYTYSVYRSESPDGPFTKVADGLVPAANNNPQAYSDASVAPGVTYYYVVTSTNVATNEESAFSTQISGSSLGAYAHLTSNIPSSITINDDDEVTLWTDQTTNGFNATSAGGAGKVFYPSLSPSDSGLFGLDMGNTPGRSTLQWFSPAQQKEWLDFSPSGAALPHGGFAIVAVVHPDQILGGSNRDVVISSREGEFALRYEQGRPQVRLGIAGDPNGPSVLQGSAGAVTADKTVVLAVSYNATTGELALWDSTSKSITTTTVAAADFSSPAPIFLGGSANPDQFMKGMLGEVKLLRGTLSQAQLLAEAESLVVNWGLPDLTWTGAETSEWSTNTIAGLKNWSATGSLAKDYLNGSAVIFNDTASRFTVNITDANVSPLSVAFQSGSYVLHGDFGITGPAPVTVAAGASLRLGSSDLLPHGSSNGNLTVNGILDLNGNSDTINALTGTGTVDNTAADTVSTLTVGANAGGTFAGSLTNSVGTLALTKIGASDVILTGINTYSGATTVNQNRLFIAGPNAFSPNTEVTVNNSASLVLNVSGTPAYTQSITLNTGANLSLRQAATLSNVTLPASGSVRFNFDDAATQAFSLTSAQTLSDSLTIQVGGGNTSVGAVTLNAIISGEGGSLVKAGPGRLILRGANTFDGGVIIKNGTLESQAVQTTLGSGTVTMGGTGSTGVTYLTGQSNSNPFVIDAPDSGAVVIGANGAGSGFTLSGAITLNGDLTIQSFNNTAPVPPATTRASATFTGGITGSGNLILNNLGLAANTFIFNTGAINHTGSLTLQGTATGDTEINVPVGENVTGITQNSATSTLVLSGANTYASNLTINAGTVRITNNSNTANDASTVTIAATGATLDLTYEGTDTVGRLIIGEVELPAGVYGPSATQIPQITGTGTLTVGTSSNPFNTWSGGLAFADDANGDGVSNGLAWILGAASPESNALDLLPQSSITGTDLIFTFQRVQDSIDSDVDLAIEVSTNLAQWPDSFTVGVDTQSSSPGITVAKDSPQSGVDTITLTQPRGSNPRMFARLKVEATD